MKKEDDDSDYGEGKKVMNMNEAYCMSLQARLTIYRPVPRSARLQSTPATNRQPRRPRPARMARLLRPRRHQLLRRVHVLARLLSPMMRSMETRKELLSKKMTNSLAPARETPIPSNCRSKRFKDGLDHRGNIMPSSVDLEDCRRYSCCYLKFGTAERKRS